MTSGSVQFSLDPYNLSSDDEEYLTPNNLAETTPGQSDLTAHLMTAARVHLNSLHESPKNWVQVIPNLNDYHSDPLVIWSTLWIPDITDRWWQQEGKPSKYADSSNVARDIISIITTWCWSGGLLLPWMRCYRQEGVKNRRRESLRISCCKAVWRSHQRDIGRQWPSIGYMERRKHLRNEEWGRGKKFAQNGQGPRFMGDVAGQPKPTCYTEGISISQHPADSHRIHLGYGSDRQSILVTIWTWWCGCIWIVGMIMSATSFVCKGPPWSMNSNSISPLNQRNQPSSSRMWRGESTCKHFGHSKLSKLELWHG